MAPRHPGRRAGTPGRARALAWVDGGVLTLYGLVYTVVGLLLQAGVIGMPAAPNRRAFAWHTFLWDPWFLVWGLLVVVALLRSRLTAAPAAGGLV